MTTLSAILLLLTLVTIAVQMFLNGVARYLQHGNPALPARARPLYGTTGTAGSAGRGSVASTRARKARTSIGLVR